MKKSFTAIATIVAALAMGISRAPAQDSSWATLVAAAKKEGQVTLYSTQLGQPYQDDIIKLFEAKYGIRVQLVALRTNEIRERIRADQAAGQAGADISYNGSTTSELQMAEGRFQPFGALQALGALRSDFQSDGTLLPVSIQGYGILVNTRLVKPEEEPKSWQDLLDPKWKGRILSADQRELVIDRLMALEADEIDIEQVKWVVLMVLFSQPGQESAYAQMEDLVFEERTDALH